MYTMAENKKKSYTDGRTLRAEKRREKIFETMISFYREGIYNPSISEIEQRSGISRRTLHHLFKNAEGIAIEISNYLRPTYEKLYTFLPTTGSLNQRIYDIVQHRAKLFETVAPTRRAALHKMSRVKTLARDQEELTKLLRYQLLQQFEKELAMCPETLFESLDLLTSWDTWERLRTIQKLPVISTSELLCEMIYCQVHHSMNP